MRNEKKVTNPPCSLVTQNPKEAAKYNKEYARLIERDGKHQGFLAPRRFNQLVNESGKKKMLIEQETQIMEIKAMELVIQDRNIHKKPRKQQSRQKSLAILLVQS